MPFRRRGRRARPRRRRRRTFRRRRVVRSRRMALDPERKFVPLAGTNNATDNGTVLFINGAVQGFTPIQRIGLQQLNTGVVLSYKVVFQPGAATLTTQVRIALVWYKQPRLLVLDLVDVWEANGSVHAPQARRQLESVNNYTILWSRNLKLDMAHQIVTGTISKSMRRLTRYSTAGGAATDVTTGSLWFVQISDRGQGPFPVVTFTTRVRFVG